MKPTLADLDRTSQRPTQLRSISVQLPYIRAFFWRGEQQCQNCTVWVYAAVVRQTASTHSLLSTTFVHWPNLTAVYCAYVKQMRLPSSGWQRMALSTR